MNIRPSRALKFEPEGKSGRFGPSPVPIESTLFLLAAALRSNHAMFSYTERYACLRYVFDEVRSEAAVERSYASFEICTLDACRDVGI